MHISFAAEASFGLCGLEVRSVVCKGRQVSLMHTQVS